MTGTKRYFYFSGGMYNRDGGMDRDELRLIKKEYINVQNLSEEDLKKLIRFASWIKVYEFDVDTLEIKKLEHLGKTKEETIWYGVFDPEIKVVFPQKIIDSQYCDW